MPKRRYRNSIRSEQLLFDAYLKIAESGGRMTVSAVCSEAGLNRSTFYKHFLDIDDLRTKLSERLLDDLRKTLEEALANDYRLDPHAAFARIGSFVERSQAQLRLAITAKDSFLFGDTLRMGLLETIGIDNFSSEVHFDCVVGGLTAAYRTWIMGGYEGASIEAVNEQVARWLLG